MLPTINGKSFLDCSESDLQVLIENPDYRENDYIDYKATFAFLEVEKNDPQRPALLAEFRSDVCQFANADGGYLIYGIKDKRGMASEIIGVKIPGNNPDRFELERKNNLVPIMPKLPSLKFKFIPLSNQNYVVIIAIARDGYAPYLHLENESDYRIYKRIGNGKRTLSYMELKNMFIQSRSLEHDIWEYRKRRLDYFRANNESVGGQDLRFLLLHIIPDTFTDSSYNKNVFMLERSGKVVFSPLFSGFGCTNRSIPNVDGLRYGHYENVAECFVTNNGIIECFVPLDHYTGPLNQRGQEYLAHLGLWNSIASVVIDYFNRISRHTEASRVFVCITLAACKGLVTESSNFSSFDSGCTIDRNELLCAPIVFRKEETENIEEPLALLKVEYLLSIGVRHAKELDEFAKRTDSQ